MIDALLEHFGLTAMPQAGLLRNIALHHHETVNGKGYPTGWPARTFRLKPASQRWRTSSTPSPANGPTRKPGAMSRPSRPCRKWPAIFSSTGIALRS